ncbi:MAG: hypothetical protein AB8F94_12295 [Saprospiraceae bacterium]
MFVLLLNDWFPDFYKKKELINCVLVEKKSKKSRFQIIQNYLKVHPSNLDDLNYGNELWEIMEMLLLFFKLKIHG